MLTYAFGVVISASVGLESVDVDAAVAAEGNA